EADLDALLEELGGGEAGEPPAPEGLAPGGPLSEARPPEERTALDLVAALIEAAREVFFETFAATEGLVLARRDFLVYSSSGAVPGGFKHSFHVHVLPFAVASCTEAGEFAGLVVERLPPAVRPFVDLGVYSRTQCFRLEGSTKPGQRRPKVADPATAGCLGTALGGGGAAEALVTAPPGLRRLPPVLAPEAGGRPRRPDLDTALAAAALDLAEKAGVTEGFALRGQAGGVISFDRVGPSPRCRLCERTHDTESSLMLSIAAGAGRYRVYELCRRAKGRRRLLGELPAPAPGRALSGPELLDLLTAGEQPAAPALRPAGGPGPRPPGAPAPAPAPRPRLAGAPEPASAPGPSPPGAPPARTAPRGRPGPPARRAGRARPEKDTAGVAACQRRVEAVVGALQREGAPREATLFERCARANVYSAPEMRAYELEPTLAVRAQMKMGKTKALRLFVDRHFPANAAEPAVIRFVTFRRTFGHAVARSFPDFELYSDLDGELSAARHPRLIVQVESLQRVRIPAGGAPPDLLVLDEVESVLAQFSSGLHRALGAAFAVFQWMLRHARHVVCMDADLGDRTFRALERMRPGLPPFLHWNRFERAAGDRFAFTADMGAWLVRLNAALDAGKRLVVPTNSLREARSLAETLRQRLGASRVGLYCSETPGDERRRAFGDVHAAWGALDALVYTP
ncbi:MAG TPA: hypothetical protein VNI01_02005, partial [Elusimicrobiota bacterium]|nr:hypothetical protein [Elusimicrobiota bacterium]